MSKKQTAAQAAAARQKKILIGGGVLLAVVLVIQGPKMLKLMSGGSSSTAAPAAAPAPLTPATPSPTAVTPGATTPSGAGSKLVSFETFGTKDPFAPQVSSSGSAAAKPAASSASASGTASSASPASVASSTSSTTSSAGTPVSATGSQQPTFKVTQSAGKATATVTVNGKTEQVAVSADFPAGDPVFQLVSVASGSVQVAIAGGSLKTGGKTFALTVGKPLTLLNTANNKRYKLELVSTAPTGA